MGWKGFSEHSSQAAALLHCAGTTGNSFWCLVFGNVVALIHREGGCGPQKSLEAATFTKQEIGNPSLFCLRCTKGSLEWAGKASVNIHHRPPHSFTVLAPLEKAFGAWSLEMLLPSSVSPLLPAKFKRNHSTLQAYLERNSTLAFAKGAKE